MSQLIDDLNITLSKDEALVLFEFFARFDNSTHFVLRNNAEYIAFSKISGQLDKTLSEPFNPNYPAIYQAAQERLAEGYEGLAPGVNP